MKLATSRNGRGGIKNPERAASRSKSLHVCHLDGEADGDDDDEADGPLIAALDMAAVALGIWLSEEAVMGPLATVAL
ncbi:MAG: hypothetical protein FWE35_23100 [Streptosporangiales bacterium]|nr:hypothetical protein [Streptosporangiales bacterium]